ncbi:MAG TPA: hypothetical protein VGZ73_11870 [Bryobacteraceae bacterium]|nr:hypothetical protein [Bryobacteraceae bacterium]
MLSQAGTTAPTTITQIIPNTITAGSPATTLRILGTGLQGACAMQGVVLNIINTSVTWNGTTLSIFSETASPTEIDAIVPASLLVNPGTATVTVNVPSNSGPFTCSNAAVSSTVQVTPPVPPGSVCNGNLCSSTGTVTFPSVPPGQLPPPQTISILSLSGTLNFSVTTSASGANFLSVSPLSGVATPGNPGAVTISIKSTTLAPGTYSATVTITAGTQQITVPVSFTVQGVQNDIKVTQNIMVFGGLIGAPAPASQSLPVATLTGAALTFTYTISSGVSWLSVSLPAGGAPGNLTVAAQPAGLTPGPHTAFVTLTATGHTNSYAVSVTLIVKSIPDDAVAFSYQIGGSLPSPQQKPIAGSGAIAVGAASDQNDWLSVKSDSDSAPANLTVAASPVSLPPGTYHGILTITDLNVEAVIISATLTVTPGGSVTATQVFPHFADGGGWQTDFLVINPNSTNVTVELRFHVDAPDSGVNIQGQGTTADIPNIPIPPNGSAFYRTAGLSSPSTVSGWVEVVSSLPLNGSALFRRHPSDGKYYEGSIPLATPSSTFTVPFDGTTYPSNDLIGTGLALANPSASAAAQINCTAYGLNGNMLGSNLSTRSLPALGHDAFILDASTAVGRAMGAGRGLVVCNSNTPVATLGLRAFGLTAISSLPVAISSPAASTRQVFPHFADQGGWQTDFLLINPNPTNVTVELRFHVDAPDTGVNIQGQGTTSDIPNIPIPPNGSAFYRTAGLSSPNTVSGWVEVISSSPLSGSALFRRHPSDGKYYEGSIPLATPSSTFTIPFDGTTYPSNDLIGTGLALANPSASAAAQVNCTAYGLNGSVLGSNLSTRSLPALGHDALILDASTAVGRAIGAGRGLVVCNSNTPVAPLGLRAFGLTAISSLPVATGQ